MQDDSTFVAVNALSGSDDEPPPVEAGQLAISNASQPSKRSLKRKRRQSVPIQQSVSDEAAIRAMLGKPKCHCKRQCVSQFCDDASFAELLSFRRQWASMHKLDQDNEAAGPNSSQRLFQFRFND